MLLSLTSNRIRDAREFVFGFAGARPRVFFGHPFLAVGRNIPYNSSHRDQRGESMSTGKKGSAATHSGPRAGRWRLQDAKARFSEVVREAQQRGPQRVTLHGKDAVVIVGADEFDRLQRPVTGRDIVTALAASPLAEVKFDRLTVKSRVRNISL
jgi:prevent-host-death family protein